MKRFINIVILFLLFSSFSLSYYVEKGKEISNDIFLTGEDLKVDGKITGDITLINGNLILAGKVKGNVSVINGSVILKSNSRINGDIIIVSGKLKREKNTKISGRVFYINAYKKTISSLFKNPLKFLLSYSYSLKDRDLSLKIITSFGVFFLALLIVIFFPENILFSMDFIKNKRFSGFFKLSTITFLALIAAIFLSIILCAIFIGVLLLLLLSLLLVASIIYGRAVIFVYLGEKVIGKKRGMVLKLFVADIIYLLLNFIPGVAVITHILLLICVIGISILTFFGKKQMV